MKTVIGLFDDLPAAESAVDALAHHNFDRADISIAGNPTHAQHSGDLRQGDARKQAIQEGALAGAGAGAAIGTGVGGMIGLLAGIGTIFIPGIGPILAAGPLISTLTGAGVGAAAGAAVGGLVGALTQIGVPERDAHFYAEAVRRGGSLVIVQATEDRVDDVADILGEHGAVDVDRRREHFEATGFSPHDAAAQVAEERAAYRIHDDVPSATRDVRAATRDAWATTAAEPRIDPPVAERRGARIYAPDAEGAPSSPIPLREPPIAGDIVRRSDVAVEEIDVDDLDVRVTTPFGRRIPPPPPLARRTVS